MNDLYDTPTLHASHEHCTNINAVKILVLFSQLPDISFVEFQGTRPMEELRDVQETGFSKYLHLQFLGDALVLYPLLDEVIILLCNIL